MADNVYECMFIFDSNRFARDPAKISGEVEKVIEKAGGTLKASRLWDERRLAYPIRKQRKGTYWLTYFEIDASKLTELERHYQISDSILRHLVLKVDPRLVDTLVQHASGDKPEGDKPEGDKPKGDKPKGKEKPEGDKPEGKEKPTDSDKTTDDAAKEPADADKTSGDSSDNAKDAKPATAAAE